MADGARAKQKEMLVKAIDLLRTGDANGFSVTLAASHALDGLVHAMQRKWPEMDDERIDEGVSTAVEALYEKVLDGGVVSEPWSYLWKAAFNTLANIHGREQSEQPFDDQQAVGLPPEPDQDARRDFARAEAVRLARSFLPKLGRSEALRKVMAYIIDAAEVGEFSIDNEQIAQATGLTAESVRRLKWRGFQRLKRLARDAEIELDDCLPVEAGEGEPDDEEDEE
jgi:DNA-directed RNA polymerase specialized sigma24 family protein